MKNERIVIDTNILLYILDGDKQPNAILQGRDVVASAMVRMEALVYHGKDTIHLEQVQKFLDRCELEEIHRSIQDLTVVLRKTYKLKIPDAIIAATAIHRGIPLITADKTFARLRPEYEVLLYER